MILLPGFGFLEPLLLLGLLALPILWLLLRATPPSPMRLRFPAVVLLLGLRDRETTPDRTPWWLLLLRMLAAAAAIVGFAGPVMNPDERPPSGEALVIAMDASWASAKDWERRRERVLALLRQAESLARPVVLLRLTDPPDLEPLAYTAGRDAQERMKGLKPQAWEPLYQAWAEAIEAQGEDHDTVWLSDGLVHDDDAWTRLAAALRTKGRLSVIESEDPVFALRAPRIESGRLTVTTVRSSGYRIAPIGQRDGVDNEGLDVSLIAIGSGPDGVVRGLARTSRSMAGDSLSVDVSFDLPTEISNRVQTVALEPGRSAGSVLITDDSVRQRRVAINASADRQEGSQLLSPLHYIRQALAPSAQIIETGINEALDVNPDVLVLADVGRMPPAEEARVVEWVEGGGLLLRFAGPRLAASGIDRPDSDPLLPVRLRAGGRSVGGALSWGDPKRLQAFPEDGPFAGLPVPEDVLVRRQVMAQPDPELADRVLASLQDGTPLVTGRSYGLGRIILFHVSAEAGWSSLPLSGLFVDMLERLAVSARRPESSPDRLAGLNWTPRRVMDAFGTVRDEDSLHAVSGEDLATGRPGPGMPPGIYESKDRNVALNVLRPDRDLTTPRWPDDVEVATFDAAGERELKAWFLLTAFVLLVADLLATLAISGRIGWPGLPGASGDAFEPGMTSASRSSGTVQTRQAVRKMATVFGIAMVAGLLLPALLARSTAAATEGERDSVVAAAANNTVLAYVVTGDPVQDRISAAGLLGLSTILFQRTTVEPIEPVGVDPALDDLSVFPFLYWPMSAEQPVPGEAAFRAINAFLRTGGVILFDTLDAGLGQSDGSGPNVRKFRRIAAGLDIPPLERIPPDHVITRSFYLIQGFPGRHTSTDVWVEASPADAEQIAGVPFRNLNDGVTPVVIGGNDWASAWAIDDNGQFLLPVGRGASGFRQRELAYRFGINLIMYVLTGNYKSDQVHVPALLQRLGQ